MLDGLNEIDMRIVEELRIVSTNNVQARFVRYNLHSLNNQDPVQISVQFVDNNNAGPPLNRSYSSDDRVVINGIELNLNSAQREYSNSDTKITIEETGTPKKKFGTGKKVHPSSITRLRRNWRQNKLKIKPRVSRRRQLG